ncbi:hypothetical protein ACFSZS_06970 [Seohaeicola zhoushanensis]
MSNSLDAQTDEIRQLMRQKLGVRGRDFPTALARAKRRLPKALRKEGQMLAAALPMADHPKLGQTLDRARLDRAAGAARASRCHRPGRGAEGAAVQHPRLGRLQPSAGDGADRGGAALARGRLSSTSRYSSETVTKLT